MRNPVAAATGRGGNANDRDDMTRNLALRIAAEAIAVGRALGYDLEPVYGMAPDDITAAVAGDDAAIGRVEAKLFENMKRRSDDQRPSMGQDIAKGRRTEIDFINGLVAEKAMEFGIPTPANLGIIEAVKKVERGEAAPDPALLAEI